jgi:hypothetical protein
MLKINDMKYSPVSAKNRPLPNPANGGFGYGCINLVIALYWEEPNRKKMIYQSSFLPNTICSTIGIPPS